MRKLLAIAAAAAMGWAASTSANATLVSFADFASGNEHGVPSGTSLNIDGVNMTFITGGIVQGTFFAYFDDVFQGRPAGLGVCRVLNASNECADSSDDSIDGDISQDEFVIILFDDGPMDVTGLSFRDADHFSLNDDDVGQAVWGIFDSMGALLSFGTATFAELVAMAISGFFDNVAGIGFQFVDTEFYVESMNVVPVPLPGALPLLLSGLAGLGFAARRKKAA